MHPSVLKKILKTAKAPQEYLDAVDAHLCKDCVQDAPKAQTSKVGPPRPYEFNDIVGVDVFDLHDYEGTCFLFLNIVDMGTNFPNRDMPVRGARKSNLANVRGGVHATLGFMGWMAEGRHIGPWHSQ